VTTVEALTELYPTPVARAWGKESEVVTPLYAELIAAAPYCVLATHGPDGIDCSPRGDARGFIEVADSRTLLIPDRRGNNRLDSLKNLLRCNEIGLISWSREWARRSGCAVPRQSPPTRNCCIASR
jgi:predicted pyridoxine 5'-phosphate oxidase superfamily flavin-nucleotide-binding protein